MTAVNQTKEKYLLTMVLLQDYLLHLTGLQKVIKPEHCCNSISTTGDVNGDGYSDIIIGAHLYDNGQSNEGRVFVYHGSSWFVCYFKLEY